MLKTYDIIIVGGGPAGSTLGYLLSKIGYKVAIFEKYTVPRNKLCGGLVTEKCSRLICNIFNIDTTRFDNLFSLKFITNEYEIRYKTKRYRLGTSEYPFRFIDREHFDNYLLNCAKDVGCFVIDGEPVIGVSRLNNTIVTKNGLYQAELLVGADGSNGIVSKSFPTDHIDLGKWIQNLAIGIEVKVNKSDFKYIVRHPIIIFGYCNTGYSWVFPWQNNLLIGMGFLTNKNPNNILGQFNHLLKELGIFTNNKIKYSSHSLPYGYCIQRPCVDRLFLVGDAAGLVDPLSGEGIYYAIASSYLLANAINYGNTISDYRRLYIEFLKHKLLTHINKSKQLRHLLSVLYNNCVNSMFGIPLTAVFSVFSTWFVRYFHGITNSDIFE